MLREKGNLRGWLSLSGAPQPAGERTEEKENVPKALGRVGQGGALGRAVESGSWCHLLLQDRKPTANKITSCLSPSVKFSWKFPAWPSCPWGERKRMVNLFCVSHAQVESWLGQEVGSSATFLAAICRMLCVRPWVRGLTCSFSPLVTL